MYDDFSCAVDRLYTVCINIGDTKAGSRSDRKNALQCTIYYVVAEVPESWEKKGDFLVAPSTGSSGEATISVIQWNTPALQETYQEQVDLLFQHDYEAYEDVFNNLYSGDGVLQKIQAYRYEEQEIFEVQYLDTEQDENIILYRKDIPYCIVNF